MNTVGILQGQIFMFYSTGQHLDMDILISPDCLVNGSVRIYVQ